MLDVSIKPAVILRPNKR
uniref:Uncharacterized protein n=1 Tax=Arundo donax TaxID=35708 RepID=A0A0A9HCB4_ARUDO